MASVPATVFVRCQRRRSHTDRAHEAAIDVIGDVSCMSTRVAVAAAGGTIARARLTA